MRCLESSTRQVPAASGRPAEAAASSRRLHVVLALLATTMLWLACGPLASAGAAAGPHWTVVTQAAPTDFHPGDTDDFYEVVAINDGGAPTNGEITLTDTHSPNLTVAKALAWQEYKGGEFAFREPEEMSCATPNSETVTCTGTTAIPTGRRMVAKIVVEVAPDASGTLTNDVTISGGGAADATDLTATPITPSSQAVPYGVSFAGDLTTTEGGIDTQAGSHPFEFTTMLAFNVASVTTGTECEPGEMHDCAQPVNDPKDIEVMLPPGLVGNPTAVPYCSPAQFFRQEGDFTCPAYTQVGGMYLLFPGRTEPEYVPVYNIEPPQGQPAELGFSVGGAHLPMYFHVRSDGDYGLTADISDITEQVPVRAVQLSIWGVPAEEVHNEMRASELGEAGQSCDALEGCATRLVPKPFLTLPSSCPGGSLSLPIAGDSWQGSLPEPLPTLASVGLAGMTGCGSLAFSPSVAAEPSSDQAGAPTGYDVQLSVPQNEEPQGLATPDVSDVEVALPAGTTISPSAANGLVGCSEAAFQPKSGERGACPSASQIGTVKITTPLLSQPVTGKVYVGEPECDPCGPQEAAEGKMVRLLIEARLPEPPPGAAHPAVLIKLAGHTEVNQANGQLTTVFVEDPQLPFSDFELSLENGPDAPLRNPTVCGPIITTARLTPWSALGSPVTALAPAVNIGGCSSEGFAPSFAAGMTGTARGGEFSGFAVTLARQDGEQTLGSVSVTTPPGLLGVLKGVTQCSEVAANAGTCPASSELGSSTVTVGPGTEPYTISGGKVFLTEKYAGAPFGLAIVTPAQAGPYTLAGNTGHGTEVVRASIAIDRRTAQVTVRSGALPTTLDGVVLDIRQVVVNIDRASFMFNPTNCSSSSVNGAIASSAGAIANVSAPFQAVDCASLHYSPKIAMSTQAKTSKADGASLNVKITAASGQANTAKVKLVFPKQLPVRDATLHEACGERQFAANPSGCPAGAVIGSAMVDTPVLSSTLRGPIYLVSHGGAAFPDAVIVLQGEGVTLELVGNTNIIDGVITSTFNSVPDAPFTSFEANLPEGSHSIFSTDIPSSAKNSLCGIGLSAPTTFTGQNGAVLDQTTPITVRGCPYAIVVRSKHVAGSDKTLKVEVEVPSAGRLIATGNDVKRVSKVAAGRGLVTMSIPLERGMLGSGITSQKKAKGKVKLTFVPKAGKKLTLSLSFAFRQE